MSSGPSLINLSTERGTFRRLRFSSFTLDLDQRFFLVRSLVRPCSPPRLSTEAKGAGEGRCRTEDGTHVDARVERRKKRIGKKKRRSG